MEAVRCPSHKDSFCILKTGTKPGATKDVSFYLCTLCGFSIRTKLPPLKCSVHDGNVVEIQALVEVSKQLWRNFRCPGREEGKTWCGNIPMPMPEKEKQQDRMSSHNKSREKATNGGANDDKYVYKKTTSPQPPCDAVICDKNAVSAIQSPDGKDSGYDGDGSVILISEDEDDDRQDEKENKVTETKQTDRSKSSNTLQSFSDVSKLQNKKSQLKLETKSFQNDSFTQYRDSPVAVKPVSTQRSKQRTGSDSSDSDNGEDVKQAGTLFERLNISKEKKSPEPESQKEIPRAVDMATLRAEREDCVGELKKLKGNLKIVKLDILPDKGQRILKKIKSLEETIASYDKELSKVPIQPSVQRSVTDSKASEPQIIKVYPGKPGQANGNTVPATQIVKVYPGKPGQADGRTVHVVQHHSAASMGSASGASNVSRPMIIPPHHMQHLFSANPQAMTLYGGRMTAKRLIEVGTITTEAITKLHEQIKTIPDASEKLSDPDGLRVTLMPHQSHALAWLQWRERQHPPSGALADDMGLGKTLTMLSHVLRQKQSREASSSPDTDSDPWMGKKEFQKLMEKGMKKSRATLIVAPASLIHQWAHEIDRRCGSRLNYLIYHGPNRETRMHKLINQDVIITTYAIVSREVGVDKASDVEKPVNDDDQEQEGDTQSSSDKKAEHTSVLMKIGWERVILDEAHEIKNHKSIKAQSVSRLRAAYRWALTGTPIQNDLKDMYSLLRFLRFSPFDELKVWKKHIESARGSTQRLNTIVKALLLRRTKQDSTSDGAPLVKLPSKDMHRITVELNPDERKIYDKLFRKTQSTVREYVRRHMDGPERRDGLGHPGVPKGAVGGNDVGQGFAGSNSVTDSQPTKKGTGSQILVLLLRLRQCCCHLSLMKGHLESESLETDGIELSLEEQMKGLMLGDLMEPKESGESSTPQQTSMMFEKSTQSTKLKCVMDKIKDIKKTRQGDKCVVVSQWTSMLEIVALHLKKEGISYSLIQGSIPAKKRADIVDDFNLSNGVAQVMLVSLRAGGVGLNLIGGNHLFLLDFHWNPALEEQACDRIYRLGQKKDVNIYRFLCKDTIEEKISSLQEGKLRLAKTVLTGMDTTRQKLSLNDLRLLFGI